VGGSGAGTYTTRIPAVDSLSNFCYSSLSNLRTIGGSPILRRVLEDFDADGDGAVSLGEALIKQFDFTQDGVLGEEHIWGSLL